MGKTRARLRISGIVQGVCFRAATVEVARDLGVKGWVRNNPDGTVEALVEGDEERVKKVIEWCHEGPPMARVDHVAVGWEAFRDEFDGFAATL
ncbi:MAG: acylphosphatase [Thermodesulfobacteriota bacterium]